MPNIFHFKSTIGNLKNLNFANSMTNLEFIMLAVFLLPSSVMAASAVAIDKGTQRFGVCHSKANLNDAKQCAINNCEQQGGTSCVVKGASNSGVYGAIAVGEKGAIGFSIGYHQNEGQPLASKEALFSCAQSYDEIADCPAESSQCQAQSRCKIVETWEDTMATESRGVTKLPLPSYPDMQPNKTQEIQSYKSNVVQIHKTKEVQPYETGQIQPYQAHELQANRPQPKVLNAEGLLFLKEKRFDEAIATYTQIINDNPNLPGAYNNRGSAYSKKSPPDYQAAFQDFDQAIRLRPSGMYYYNRALMSQKLGNQQGYLDDMLQSAQMGFALAKTKLEAMQQRQGPAPAAPAPAPSNSPTPPSAAAPTQPGGYQTCSLPADRIANRGGIERAADPAYSNVCIAILPPTCRNWTMNRQPCAVRACVVPPNLNRCPSGEPPSYVAKEVLPVTPAELAAMNAQIDAAAKHIAAQRGNGGATPAGQYWQTQIMHRQTEWANGGAGGVTYNGQ